MTATTATDPSVSDDGGFVVSGLPPHVPPDPTVPGRVYVAIDRDALRTLVALIDDTIAGYDYDPYDHELEALDAARAAIGEAV